MPPGEPRDKGTLQVVKQQPSPPSTEALVNAVRAGEKLAFSRLVGLYQRVAIVTAHSILHDADRAQDAVQEAFVIAYTKLNQLQTAAAFGPWLLKIVRRCAIANKKRTRELQLGTDVATQNIRPPGDFLQRYEDVIEQVARLSEDERTVVVLRYMDGLSIQETADTTGKSVVAIKKQLSRALARLRQWLKEIPS